MVQKGMFMYAMLPLSTGVQHTQKALMSLIGLGSTTATLQKRPKHSTKT
jgi:hypothetical protein